jgi:hypothetical protein
MAHGDTHLTNLVLTGDLTVADDVTVSGDVTVTGTLTASTPIGVDQVNNSVARQRMVVPIQIGTVADGTTYTVSAGVGRACTVTAIKYGAATKPVGGTNTFAVKKNNTTTMLNAATVDPTGLAADATLAALTLTGTAADLALDTDDTITLIWVAGTQTTDAVAPVAVIEYEVTDFS